MSDARSTVDALVANHREFLGFLERRVGDRAVAEEILQDAFVRSLERHDEIRESAVGWFYRVLRNAVIDRQRRERVKNRRLELLASELEVSTEHASEGELGRIACACIADLAGALKPEYADALQRIELDGVAVARYAEERGISGNLAGVRVFRARRALKEQVARACGTCADHGCADCSCGV